MAQSSSGISLAGIAARMGAALQGRLYTPRNGLNVQGVDPSAFPSPQLPVQPIGPPGSKPLAFSLIQGQNLNITPRYDTNYTAGELRELATYPLARICIENIKDVVCSMKWKIQIRRKEGEPTSDWKKRQQADKIGPQLTDFFQRPDGEKPWSDWLRPIIEDNLVIDASSILVDRTLSGKVAKLTWTDGADILKIVDDQGRTPEGNGWAYTQLWEGIPRIALTKRQIVYRPSNIVPINTTSSKIYGTSITQQLAPEIKIGQERLRFVLAFYVEGSTPGVARIVPPGVDPDRVKEAMLFENSEMSGNLAKRRQTRYWQGFNPNGEDQVIEFKEPILADAFDDLHIRKICFGYGTSAQRLLKQMNRASAEAGQDASEKEGVMPRVMFVKSTVDCILADQFDQPDYEWLPETDDELDAVKQSDVDKTLISTGQETIDERREARGLIPFGLPETSQPIIITPTGIQPLEGSIDRVNQTMANATASANKPAAAPVKPGAGPSEKKTLKSAKASAVFIETDKLTPRNERLTKGLQHRMARWLKANGKAVGQFYIDHFVDLNKLVKADDDDDGKQTELLAGGKRIPKMESNTIRALALLGWRTMKWEALADEVLHYLQDAGDEGVNTGISGSEASTDIEDAAREAVAGYASMRSAEMVGMVRDAKGEMVENPNAHWAISDPTLKDLERTLTQSSDEGWTPAQLAAVIEASYMFSDDRATLVSENEMMNAQTCGTAQVWMALDTIVRWRVNDLAPRAPDECDDFEEQGNVPLGHEFAEGLRWPRAHPKCRCRLEIVPSDQIDTVGL